MGLDQHFFRYPIPDPLPPKWSDEANETVEELLYLRSHSLLREAVFYAAGIDEATWDEEPFEVTRIQLGDALLYMGPDDHDGHAWDRLQLTALLLKYPDERFVYFASW